MEQENLRRKLAMVKLDEAEDALDHVIYQFRQEEGKSYVIPEVWKAIGIIRGIKNHLSQKEVGA